MRGRRIIVGLSGSIAAYKAVVLVRALVKAGAEVRVLMTPAAAAFVSPLTLSTLSKHEVLTSVISGEGWNNHVELGLWADAYVVAPATANTLARLANGICDNILAAVYLSARCPVLFAPAMDVDMWAHPSTQANVARLEGYGDTIIPVGEGELASGLSGAGRLAEPEDIVRALEGVLTDGGPLAGKHVLLTAGPTHESLDPVRFLGNRSSGKMGLALADALLAAGARVTLVLGPASAAAEPRYAATLSHARLTLVRVRTAREMHAASTAAWPDCDAAVLAAAVADYRPATEAPEKIKKGDAKLTLELVRNPDIAADLGARKRPGQVLLGFALETTDGERHARGKLDRKRLDAIALNRHTAAASAFGGDDNEVTVLLADGSARALGRHPKPAIAAALVDLLTELILA